MVGLSCLSFFERFGKMSDFETLGNVLAETIQATIDVRMGELVHSDQIHDTICSTTSAYLHESTEDIESIISDYLAGSDYVEADDLEEFVTNDDIGRLVEHEMSYRMDDMVDEDTLEDAVETVRTEVLSKINDEVEMLRNVNVAQRDEMERLESLFKEEKESLLEEMRNLKEMMVVLTQPKPSIFSKLSSLPLSLPRWFKWFK